MRQPRFLALSLAALLSSAAAQKADTLTIALDQDPPTLDPNLGNQAYTFGVSAQVFDTLLYRDYTDGQLKGRLATAWRQLSPVTWRFTLRRGVKFQDGTPFNAAAVKFTLDRILDPAFKAPNAFQLSAIKEVRVVNDDTVDIVTGAPFAPLVPTLTHPLTGIVSPTAVKKYGKDFSRHPVGTGPFAFDGWTTGNTVTLRAFKDYWQGAPKIGTVVFRIIPESATQVIELKAGRLDVLSSVPAEAVGDVEKSRGVTVKKQPGATQVYLGFNTAQGLSKDLKVRQAIAASIDRGGIVNSLLKGTAETGVAPITPRVFGAAKNLSPVAYDPQRARRLLREANVAPGTRLTLITPNTTLFTKLAQAVQFSAQQVGLTVDVRPLDFGAYISAVQKPDHPELFIYWWTPVSRDADTGLYGRFHSSNIPLNNHAAYKNATVDRLLDEARGSGNAARRVILYQQAQQQINRDLPVLTLAYPYNIYVTSDRLVGEVQNTTLELFRASLK
ncbi:ABC transporter substrate-binding protein [Deinococcus hopiensis]|uniref:Peptide/nickel transport system substrate-binding protein n=1 Tax=Deinococcus hopiensis KR-140 TaxID=695939 RepID=A0A1W1UQJ7_9DEIO|nr:ABC transporter substrate-binding protein [Deinococcus hopiensis]SMB83269.1 peptide/nickel transport system substrate-binding protein [Deinococcus hopiensis KR-140]